ncbi:hypothetical protein FD754_003822 [Muntiacus muntjak]|uniref:EF-hand domain-containing protein n=1 Tax=Muntiacus muntjak TaxID=9888 RepID=A0A5N3WH97_MUNMU|nr:hypothetical protein FD754_003822 [Muntiacus muntjak]
MSSVWKTPRGSNAMPEMKVKIIGSKHVRYLVEKPKIKEIKPINPKGNQPQIFIGGTDAEAEAPVLWPPDTKSKLTEKNKNNKKKPRCWGRLRTGGEGDNRGWYLLSPKCKLNEDVLFDIFFQVNYEKLLWFLKVAASEDTEQNKGVEDSNVKETQSSSHQRSIAPQDYNSQSEVNESLLEVLKMALRATKAKLNIEKLNLSFRKEDRSFSGCLPPPKVRAICGKHGLYLTLSLLETLLNHQDLGKKGKEISATPGHPEVPEISQGKTEQMKTPGKDLKPENTPAETSAPKDILNALKIRPVSQPSVSPVMKNTSEECETWIDRFRKLENALYLCDLSNTGVLEKERARRLIHNYNLIYNLSLSPRKIDQALRSFRAGENMLLEPALRYLKEL